MKGLQEQERRPEILLSRLVYRLFRVCGYSLTQYSPAERIQYSAFWSVLRFGHLLDVHKQPGKARLALVERELSKQCSG